MRKLFSSRGRGGAAIAAASACALVVLVAAPSASAAQAQVYNNIPHPLPGNTPSVGYEATSTSEFGGLVDFDSTQRNNPKLTVTMSSWACQSGNASTGDCSSSPTATFNWPIRFNVYRVRPTGEPGRLIGKVSHTYTLPYRPSANFTKCTGANAGKWFSVRDGKCNNGRAVNITANLGSLDLPEQAIISVEYDTTHFGYDPVGEGAPCFGSSGGCPYDSLNVGTFGNAPSVGTQPRPDDAYLYSTSTGAYCDGSLGTGTFRLDEGCWTGFQPAFKVAATD
jgi:hypothetical protein